jgi:hypothetical protein
LGLPALVSQEFQGQVNTLDLAEPSLRLCSAAPGVQVSLDLVQAREHARGNVQDRATKASMLVLAAGSVRAGAVVELDLAPVEVLLEFAPFTIGHVLVFLGWALRTPTLKETLVVTYDFVVEDSDIAASGFEAEVAEQGSADVNRQAAVDQLGGESLRKSWGVKTRPEKAGSAQEILSQIRCRERTTVPAVITAGPACPGRWNR